MYLSFPLDAQEPYPCDSPSPLPSTDICIVGNAICVLFALDSPLSSPAFFSPDFSVQRGWTSILGFFFLAISRPPTLPPLFCRFPSSNAVVPPEFPFVDCSSLRKLLGYPVSPRWGSVHVDAFWETFGFRLLGCALLSVFSVGFFYLIPFVWR